MQIEGLSLENRRSSSYLTGSVSRRLSQRLPSTHMRMVTKSRGHRQFNSILIVRLMIDKPWKEVDAGIKTGAVINLLGLSQSSEESPPRRSNKRGGGGGGGGYGGGKQEEKRSKLNPVEEDDEDEEDDD
jgi:hypothetical protein